MKKMNETVSVNARERCYEILDLIPEEQLRYVVLMLESTHRMISETLDDAFCLELYRKAKTEEDNLGGVSLDEYAEKWGIDIRDVDYAD